MTVADRSISASIPPRRLWVLGAGYGAWCSALVVMYALHAVGCAYGWPSGAVRLGLAVVLLAHLALIGWLWRGYARTSPDPASGATGAFVHWVILWTLITAFVATVLVLAPALLLATCV
jgi:hypothetical protein